MPEQETIRISKVTKELNIGLEHLVDFLHSKGFKEVERNLNSKINMDAYNVALGEFLGEKQLKEKSDMLFTQKRKELEVKIESTNDTFTVKQESTVSANEKIVENTSETDTQIKAEKEVVAEIIVVSKPKVKEEDGVIKASSGEELSVTVKGKIDLDSINKKTKPAKKEKEPVTAKETKEKVSKAKKTDKATTEKPKTSKQEIISEVSEPIDPTVKAEVIVEEEQNHVKIVTADVTQKISEENVHVTQYEKIEGPKVLGNIVLPVKEEKKKTVSPSSPNSNDNNDKKKRKRIHKKTAINTNDTRFQSQPKPAQNNSGGGNNNNNNNRPFNNDLRRNNRPNAPKENKAELTPEEIQQQIKETLQRLSNKGKSKTSKYRKEKRELNSEKLQEAQEAQELEKSILRVTEFVSASELAKMMNVAVNEVISTCLSLGMFVSINQRLSADTITIVAEEFGYKVEFVSAEATVAVEEDIDNEADLKPRAPIVTVMGHVDHGKTSLLDYVRKANVIAGEAGGITQHIGAYNVTLENGKQIAFLDTPGHEAFTAMRARGAQITDIVIVVVAADDNVMPQTREAINHAQAAGVPIVFAINKIDKPGANADKIREELSAMNILVEEWGGKYQCQEISAKKGTNIELLLEKVLLEAEMLDLKGNPNKNANGTVIESSLDKGRGYICTVLVQSGSLQVGDVVLAGSFSGKVKALTNERNQSIKKAGPSTPALMLGLSGAPQAGDKFKVMNDEREAREIANKRLQLMREQGIRTQKHITLDEIGRRLAIGDFKELNIIVKGDVDGSIEALTDSLLKLSTQEIQVNVIHKSVGQVTESDVLLASASNAIIVAFQVRPSQNARKLAEQEQIDIRTYSIIYKAIEEVKAAMEGMLAPEFEEKIVCNVQIRQVFKISKVGTIAGCFVTDGKINRNTKVRIIRNGIVIHSGELGSLKRFKDDVKEVLTGYECGLNINNFNDIEVDDIIEGYEMVEIKRKL
jgi:translation initiation factor IF-2